ncbi:lysophospholipid acyltransferase family protein [Rhizosphaericola mali]|uniref:1-acyl-sn-glycerol-3-phosphate acyltransferase n=1 Tax=Rhizosphaericola mali TaxID=2545455 RepID=A0A5P2FVB8_9BACT|nr:lysophospholipid acyltransferase family protein [Rhizosphaericola mali]QES87434.1 1-acyl-sn-glycerol-3-phosphate acyltransferase [Rhizosphaericola mali]
MKKKNNALVNFFLLIYNIYAFSVFFLLMLFVAFFVFVFAFFPEPQSGNLIYRVLRVWALTWFTLIGIKLRVKDETNEDANASYIFVSNHQSYMDIPVSVAAIRTPFRILGKIEMSKIPLFGFIYKKAVILVDRSSALRRSESYINLRNTIKKGLSVLIYPEGTFNETGKPLKEFYIGAFKLAIETQTPIKPIIILNTLDRLHYSSVFSLNPGKMNAIYLPSISVTGYTKNDLDKLRDKVYDIMSQSISRYNQK